MQLTQRLMGREMAALLGDAPDEQALESLFLLNFWHIFGASWPVTCRAACCPFVADAL